ncbi:uncharacterized protein LOC111631847 [Centruroides sculpturatus]|uniref:uncharacterized protein LOC111631847 n=1 Tax=Centruroides sculpturatus TaxID=218467 RepID=UPI000C6DA676|nr:uncharacterized protein LOC111631847 [Centruroides sculpturatus]
MERIRYQEMIILIAIAVIVTRVSSVKITRLTMPRWVENGTEESVVLDCEYDLSDSDSHIVVKWFLNDDPEPIYQWIPELKARYASSRIKGRLNWDYTVSPSNTYTKYRALNIIRPTTELSGRYSCHVISLTEQDSEDQVMIVYAPPKHFEFNFTRPSIDLTNFTCEAEGVYPLPRLLLYRNTLNDVDSQLISDTKIISSKKNGAYTAKLSRIIRDRELRNDAPTEFECVLLIPGTNYKNQRNIVYYPGM